VPDVPQKDISTDDLDRIRQAAEAYLSENFDGAPRTMRVVLTTHEITRLTRSSPAIPLDPPDTRPVYVVVVEGDLRLRAAPSWAGSYLWIYVTPDFQARAHSGPAKPGDPTADRFIAQDLSRLGRVHYADT
jgi:hypothetical protein